MSDPTKSPADVAPQTKSELIESIYRIALEPQTYDTFMGQWDDFILDQISKLNSLQAAASAVDAAMGELEISNHFAIAMQLLEQAGRPELDQKNNVVGTSVPQLMFNAEGLLVWHNSAARTVFGIGHGATLNDFAMTDTHREEAKAMLAGQSMVQTVMVRVTPAQGEKPVPMAFQASKSLAQELLFKATQVRQSWPENTGKLLENGFGLSASEIDICALLVDGQNPADIAQTRSSALATVRTQIKKILQKTDCSGQVELVILLHSTMRLAEKETSVSVPAVKIPDRVLNVQLEGRMMPVETFGDPNGTPVIFFHGMLDGNSMTGRLRELLHENKIHLICPVRPSFGTASPDEDGPIQTAPARFARDIETLMDTTGIKRPILLGHMAGSIYAYATAAHLGRKARGLLAVSGGVPIISASQFASMSVRQRIVALTARYTPRVLPFVIRAGIGQLDNDGERQFLHSLYQHSPYDLRALADLEVRDIILSGYQFTIAQGHRAFEVDGYHAVRDWSAVLAKSELPIELLHGVHDPVVSIASVRDFHSLHSKRANLTELEDTGQLVLYNHPDRLITALDRLR
jgi:pimeloyl-ACP methyl ester carboxylesterase/DNA-binding CsgD family transcriptional regulator